MKLIQNEQMGYQAQYTATGSEKRGDVIVLSHRDGHYLHLTLNRKLKKGEILRWKLELPVL